MIDPEDPDYENTPASGRRPAVRYRPEDVSAAPCVTIATPYYNTGEIFLETVEAIFRQTLQQWEWLIVNDGSDSSDALTVLARYRDYDPRIRVIDHERNRGPAAARNRAAREAATPFLVWLDSDDLLEPTAVEKWFWFLTSFPEYSFVKGYEVGFSDNCYLHTHGFHDGQRFVHTNMVAITSMIRKTVHDEVGGFDEANRDGLEDWEFWLQCADHGRWGDTLPEYLSWYRWWHSHVEAWPNWDQGERQQAFAEGLRQSYPRLFEDGGFPEIPSPESREFDRVSDELPCLNNLESGRRRVLLITSCAVQPQNLELLRQLDAENCEICLVVFSPGRASWLSQMCEHTSDVFVLQNFLRLVDHPRFIRYLINSRRIDTVMLSHSRRGYVLLPYLRACYPDVTFADVLYDVADSDDESCWGRLSLQYEERIDVTLISSDRAREWLGGSGDLPAGPIRRDVRRLDAGFDELLERAGAEAVAHLPATSTSSNGRYDLSLAVEYARMLGQLATPQEARSVPVASPPALEESRPASVTSERLRDLERRLRQAEERNQDLVETLNYAPYRLVTLVDHGLRRVPVLRAMVCTPLAWIWRLMRGVRS